ncbi:MAG: nucleotide exchange factor GrpE [Desulfobacterales bacterium]|nr:nucleotide exchange factor GrpE [Desulfobacterales bacterium]
MASKRPNDKESKAVEPEVETGAEAEESVAESAAEEETTQAEEAEAEVEAPKSPEELLQEKVKGAEAKAAENHDKLLRATAEFDNYKKRSLREFQESKKYANEAFIKQLLPVIDNLERAVEATSSETEDSGKVVVEGVKMTLSEIFKVFDKFNLKALESEGKPFDPNFHQAVIQEETDEVPENTVVKVMQKGYLLHDRLIRPAMVVVSKAAPKAVNEDKKVEAK